MSKEAITHERVRSHFPLRRAGECRNGSLCSDNHGLLTSRSGKPRTEVGDSGLFHKAHDVITPTTGLLFAKSPVGLANVAIDEATTENGCLWFSPGQFDQLLPMNAVGCLAKSVTEKLVWKPVEMAPGDVVFFTSFAPHYSDGNDTDRPRRSLYLTYNKLSEGDLREQYYADRQRALADQSETGYISKIGHFQGKTVL